jgi:hypothetical protein
MLRIFMSSNSLYITSSDNPTHGEILCNGKTVAEIESPMSIGLLKQKILALVQSDPIDCPTPNNNSGIDL